MALMITDACINCGVCVPECPNGAIQMGDERFFIRGGLCTECTGKHDVPNCQALCPIEDCVIPNPLRRESRTLLEEKQRRIDLKNRIAAAINASGL